MSHFPKKAEIQWKWLGRIISGAVIEIYFEPIAKDIKGKKIKRNGSIENPAYLVQSVSGNFALKMHSKLEVRKKVKFKSNQPKMSGP